MSGHTPLSYGNSQLPIAIAKQPSNWAAEESPSTDPHTFPTALADHLLPHLVTYSHVTAQQLYPCPKCQRHCWHHSTQSHSVGLQSSCDPYPAPFPLHSSIFVESMTCSPLEYISTLDLVELFPILKSSFHPSNLVHHQLQLPPLSFPLSWCCYQIQRLSDCQSNIPISRLCQSCAPHHSIPIISRLHFLVESHSVALSCDQSYLVALSRAQLHHL